MEVETGGSVTAARAPRWAEMAASGSKLILMVPRNLRVRAAELLWENGITDRVSVGTYDLRIEMP